MMGHAFARLRARPGRLALVRGAAALCLTLLLSAGIGRAAPETEAQATVALNLVLAIDDSSSIEQDDYELQINGIHRALTSRPFVEWLETQPNGIAVCAFLFSAEDRQSVILPWTTIHDLSSARAAADRLRDSSKVRLTGLTAVGSALAFAIRLLDQAEGLALRRIVDLSGDGESNDGPEPATVRDRASAMGITINALAILQNQPSAGAFYRENVSTPDGFVVEARTYEDFERAILKKLLQEVADAGPVPQAPLSRITNAIP